MKPLRPALALCTAALLAATVAACGGSSQAAASKDEPSADAGPGERRQGHQDAEAAQRPGRDGGHPCPTRRSSSSTTRTPTPTA